MTLKLEQSDSDSTGSNSEKLISVREEKGFYRKLVESAPEAILVLDPGSSQIIYANNAASRLFGMEVGELLDAAPADLSPEMQPDGNESRQAFSDHLHQSKLGNSSIFEWRFRRSSGAEFEAELRFVKLSMAAADVVRASILDISERKRVEAALAYERNLLHVLMDNIPDYIYFKDTQSRYIQVNKAHAKGLGAVSPEDAVGKSTYDYYKPEFAEKSHADDRAVMESSKPVIARIEQALSQDGKRSVWLSTTKVPIIEASGQVVGLAGISRDVTRLKEAEEKLQDMAEAELRSRVGLEAMIEQVTTTVLELQSTIAQTAERADDVAEMAQRSVKVSLQGQKAVAASIESMQNILQRVKGIAENIQTLSEKTEQIGDITARVNDFAAQSKLLALNASLEAARAGEAGKGFAVVAMEVRRLAEQSREATGQIRSILNEILQATDNAVAATGEGRQGVDQGESLINQAGETIQNLAGVIQEVEQAMIQIAASTRHQSIGMDQLVSVMTSIRSKA